MQQWQSDLYNTPYELGYLGRDSKRLLKKLGSGEDVSDLGELSSIGQMYASERRDIGDNYGYGANALIAGSGGEQANILNRMRDVALDRSNERKGMAYTQGVLGLRNQAASNFSNERQNAINTQLQRQLGAMGSRQAYNQGQYSWIPNKGLFPTLAGMAANAGEAYKGFGA